MPTNACSRCGLPGDLTAIMPSGDKLCDMCWKTDQERQQRRERSLISRLLRWFWGAAA